MAAQSSEYPSGGIDYKPILSVLGQGCRIFDWGEWTIGYGTAEQYITNPFYFGSIVGRYANRILGAAFSIGDKRYQLDRNYLGKHHLHGGRNGSSHRNWTLEDHSEDEVVFADRLPSGHMGYPGNLTVRAIYRVSAAKCLELEIEAITDAPTPCNFAAHNYFNLDGSETVANHHLQVLAETYLHVNAEGIPLGGPIPVAGTGFDYIGSRPLCRGAVVADLDHNFCFGSKSESPRHMATLSSPQSGISMRLSSNEPGLQVYAGSGIALETNRGLNGAAYGPNAGLALEPQFWPDTPNRSEFPNAILEPGQVYLQLSRFEFLLGISDTQQR